MHVHEASHTTVLEVPIASRNLHLVISKHLFQLQSSFPDVLFKGEKKYEWPFIVNLTIRF